MAALLITAVVSGSGCTTPIVPTPDTGPRIDAATPEVDADTPEVDADTPEVDADTPEVDAAPGDAGVDAGTVTGPLSVSGGVGSRGGAIPVSGSLVVVDDGFDLGGMTCNGSLCVYGGFR